MGDNDENSYFRLPNRWPDNHRPVIFSVYGFIAVWAAVLVIVTFFFSLADISPPLLVGTVENISVVCQTPNGGGSLACNGTIERTLDQNGSFTRGIYVGKEGGQVFSPTIWPPLFYIGSSLVVTAVATISTKRWRGGVAVVLSLIIYFVLVVAAIPWWPQIHLAPSRSLFSIKPFLLIVGIGIQTFFVGLVVFHYTKPLIPHDLELKEGDGDKYISFQWRIVQVIVSASLAIIVGITVPAAFNQGSFGHIGVMFLVGMFLAPLSAILLFYMWRIYRLEVPDVVRKKDWPKENEDSGG